MRVGSIGSAAHSRALRPLHDHRARRVGAIAAGTAGTDWALNAVLTGVFGFVAAACIWWLYFDHVGSAGLELGPRTAFYWGYGHLAVYAGIAAFGVGVQLAIEGAATAEELASVAAPPPAGERGVVSGARNFRRQCRAVPGRHRLYPLGKRAHAR